MQKDFRESLRAVVTAVTVLLGCAGAARAQTAVTPSPQKPAVAGNAVVLDTPISIAASERLMAADSTTTSVFTSKAMSFNGSARTMALASFAPAPAAAPFQQPGTTVSGTAGLRHMTVSVQYGVDNSFSGKVIKEADGATTSGVPIHFDETSYDDVWGRLGLFKIGVGYRETDTTESLFNFVLSRSGAEPVVVGSAGAGAGVPLEVQFDDLSYWGFEIGQKWYFARRRLLMPYAGFLLGFNRYDDVKGTFVGVPTSVTPGLAAQDGKFFEKAWSLSLGPTGGVMVPLGPADRPHFAVTVELQFRFMNGLSDVDWLVEEGLRDINSESSRWSLPIVFGAMYRF